jgi:type VI secretion system protein ImpD
MIKNNAKNTIVYLLAKIERLVAAQLAEIYAAPALQELLTLWTELALIVQPRHEAGGIIVKLLNIQWQEIDKDLNTNLEIENTSLFDLLYETQFGVSGGDALGLVLGCFELNLKNVAVVSTLNHLGALASYCLAPFITNVSAKTFELNNFTESSNLATSLNTADLPTWQKIRKNATTRFINLCLPNIFLEIPHRTQPFADNLSKIKIRTAALLVLRALESFKNTRWFTDILGFFQDKITSQKLLATFPERSLSFSPEIFLTLTEEQAAVKMGFISLMSNKQNTDVFFSSIYSGYLHPDPIEILLEHILCACRIGHYIKTIARDKIGTYLDEVECEKFITNWLNKYQAKIGSQSHRFQYPLKNFRVKISKKPGKIGVYSCQIQLEPHMKLETLNSQITLYSEIPVKNQVA